MSGRWKWAWVPGAALALAACGGGSGDGGPSVDGGVVKGPVLGAQVCAYAVTGGAKGAQLSLRAVSGATGSVSGGCYVTGADGRYSFQLPAGTTGDVILEATGGSFCSNETPIAGGACPGGGTVVDLGTSVMSAAVALSAGNGRSTVYATPLTTAAMNAAAGASFSAARFNERFNLLAGQILGANAGVTPATPPTTGNQPYLAQVASFLQGGGSLGNAVGTLAQGSTSFGSGGNGSTSPATVHASLVGTHNLAFHAGSGAGCGSACSYTEGQSVTVTVHADGRLSLPGKELSNPFYRDYGVGPHTPEIIWLDSQAGVEYALSDNSTGHFNEINVGNAGSPGAHGIPAFLGQLRAPANPNAAALVTALAGSYPKAWQYLGASAPWTGVTIGADGAITFTGGSGPSIAAGDVVEVVDRVGCCGRIDVVANWDVDGSGVVDAQDKIALHLDADGALRSVEYAAGSTNSVTDDVGVRLGTVAPLVHDGTAVPGDNRISGTANGTVLDYATSFANVNTVSLLLEGNAGSGSTPLLGMQLVPNATLHQGQTYACARTSSITVNVTARLANNASVLSTNNGGRCDITITTLTVVGGNVTGIAGTFTAELFDFRQNVAPVTITNGVFRYVPPPN